MLNRLIIIFTFLFLCPSLVLAQTPSGQEIPSSPSAIISQRISVDYALPYPGILPDNPLYPLKATRDRVISLLISDSLKKAEFNLLQADKRLQMGVALIEKDSKKTPLALTTISKGENYFAESISKVSLAKKQGIMIEAMAGKLFIAAKKHEEILSQIVERLPQEEKDSGKALLSRMQGFEKEVILLTSKNKQK